MFILKQNGSNCSILRFRFGLNPNRIWKRLRTSLCINIDSKNGQKLSNSHVLNHNWPIFFDLSPKCIKLPTVQKKQAVMEKYRYRSDHHLKKKIKNIRNLVTYRFAEKTFALLTVIGTDTTPILHQYNAHTSLQPFDIEQKLLVPVIFLYSHYLSPQFTLFLKLLFFKDMSLEYQQNIKSMYTNKNLFRINKMLIEFSWHYLGFNHGSPIKRTYKI